MPAIISRGSFSGKAFGLTGQTTTPVYVEDVFSTYLYTGTGSAQTINNGIDLATKGGLVWIKSRNDPDGTLQYHGINDTNRGTSNAATLASNSAGAAGEGFIGSLNITSFNTNGFSLTGLNYRSNATVGTYVSWTFRKQPKFFDVVTYTGNGSARTIAHNLGATPGMIIVKRTDAAGDWWVYHSSLANTQYMRLNTTQSVGSSTAAWNSTTPTSTVFSLGDSNANLNGATYVAYLFADQAGGFGLSGSDSVVACGSFTTNASGNVPAVNLGWEPQYLLVKGSSAVSNWLVLDVLRGLSYNSFFQLFPNSSAAEGATAAGVIVPTATGFANGSSTGFSPSTTYIYLAIRRGPMKVPTSGTSVFSPNAYTGNGSTGQTITSGFPVDMYINCDRTNSVNMSGYTFPLFTRLLSVDNALETASTDAWGGGWGSDYWRIDNNIGTVIPAASSASSYNNQSGVTFVNYNFLRAPGFFDIVCYNGTGGVRTVTHNLGVVPELIIVKARNRTGIYVTGWPVYSAATGVSNALSLNETTPSQFVGPAFWDSTAPTSSVFSLGINDTVNAASNGNSYIAYLFATCPGVSKVGSYTGTGAAQNINCGFSAGARFVLIKRTDSTGDWFVYDSARGISSGNDPYLRFNVSAAEVTATNYVDTFASGFTLTATAPAALNANGGSYLFLAIA